MCVCVCMYVRPSSLQRWSSFLLLGFTDPYNHTYSESLCWKLFKNHKRAQRQRQKQWQRQWQKQRQRQSTCKTHNILYFWNPDDLFISNMMIDTSPWSSCSSLLPWLPCSCHTISSTGPSVSTFRDLSIKWLYTKHPCFFGNSLLFGFETLERGTTTRNNFSQYKQKHRMH